MCTLHHTCYNKHEVIIFVKGWINMIIVTTENIANHKVTEMLGPVFGLTVRARGIALLL